MGGPTVRRLVSGMSLSPHGGSLNTVAACENSVPANFAEPPFGELHLNGVLRSSRQVLTDGILCAGGKRPPASDLRAGERKSRAHALHDHVPHSGGEGKWAGKERHPRS